ncbi:hypothetical protein [Streptomyces sp. NBC_00989]|uniref:hypothetical protein n=1 Tax=Streptomyces sp. NBC_00989 TaxID=2903705 RepID=UPI002F919498|nr:hypothetical protein OG714_54445 [Streptomyces sp. NBC_00989]
MTVFLITPGLLLILMVSGAVGVAVYLQTKRRSTEVPGAGDLGTAIMSAAAVAAVLVSIGMAAVPSGSTDPPNGGSVPTCSSLSREC